MSGAVEIPRGSDKGIWQCWHLGGLGSTGKQNSDGWWPHCEDTLQLCQWDPPEWLFREYVCGERCDTAVGTYSLWGGEGSSMRTCEAPRGEILSRAEAPTITGPRGNHTNIVCNYTTVYKRDSVFTLHPLPLTAPSAPNLLPLATPSPQLVS